MRKVYWLLVAFLVAPGAHAVDNSVVTGGMSCEITRSASLRSEDGRPRKVDVFSEGVLGQFIHPDISIQLTYEAGPLGFSIALDGPNYGKSAVYLYEYPAEDLSSTKGRIEYNKPYSNVSFGPEKIWMRAQGDELKLSRYYKGDWHGTLSISPPFELALQIATLDCRTTEDAVEDFIASIQMKALEYTE